MRHNALAALILVDQYMIRCFVRRVLEDTQGSKPVYYGVEEVGRERGAEEDVVFR